MKCYNHHDRDAFGICHCGKALCLECMEQTNGKIHCKNSPECKEVAQLSTYAYGVMKKQGFSKKRKWLVAGTGITMLIGGCLFLALTDFIMKILGTTFVFMGLLFIINSFSMGNKLIKGK